MSVSHMVSSCMWVCVYFLIVLESWEVGKEPVVVIVGTVSLAKTRLCSEMKIHC